jgi:hypothetical protein
VFDIIIYAIHESETIETSLTSDQGGSGGKWQTPHQKVKEASRGNGKIEPGDAGVWATCARNQEGKATGELKAMLEEVGYFSYQPSVQD